MNESLGHGWRAGKVVANASRSVEVDARLSLLGLARRTRSRRDRLTRDIQRLANRDWTVGMPSSEVDISLVVETAPVLLRAHGRLVLFENQAASIYARLALLGAALDAGSRSNVLPERTRDETAVIGHARLSMLTLHAIYRVRTGGGRDDAGMAKRGFGKLSLCTEFMSYFYYRGKRFD